MKHASLFFSLVFLGFSGCAIGPGTQSPTAVPEDFVFFDLGQTIPVVDVTWKKQTIQDAILSFTKVDREDSVLGISSVEAHGDKATVSFTSIDAQGQFAVVHFTLENKGTSKFEPWLILDKGCTLLDALGRSFPLNERCKLGFLIFKAVEPGERGEYSFYFDIPKNSKPASLRLDLIKAMIRLSGQEPRS